jgi:hypothetical protein
MPDGAKMCLIRDEAILNSSFKPPPRTLSIHQKPTEHGDFCI